MAKRKRSTGLADTVGLGKKVSLKKSEVSIDEVEAVTKKIHKPQAKIQQKKMTIEIPEEIYRKVKIKVAQDGIKIKEYITQLILRDLE